jgi:hypothetical protein
MASGTIDNSRIDIRNRARAGRKQYRQLDAAG